jgi:DNA-binding SARP family transcriptional activator/tetratricopeptide (TPR) repeat protein
MDHTTVRFRLLGPVRIETDGGALTPVRRQERCLLAILLLECGRVVPVNRMCDLLWDDEPPAQAYRAVRSQVAHLRALLTRIGAGADVTLISDPNGYLLKTAPDTVDAHLFRTLVARADQTADPARRDQLLRDALALWRGPALHNAASDRLRLRLCAELDELRLHAVEESMASGLALGRDRELLPELAQLDGGQPIRERFVELHMLALYRQGRTAEALAVYDNARRRLADELGLDPSPVLGKLHQAILHGDLLPSPEPSRPQTFGPPGPALLPADPPGFAGRTEHLDRLDALLAGNALAGNALAGNALAGNALAGNALAGNANAAVVSAIAGTAGIGKSALAVHWAHRVRDRFPDGQLYANLRGFDPGGTPTPPAEVIRRFLDALHVPAHRVPAGLDAQADLYRTVLADKRVLILLDNARDPDQVRPLFPGARGCLTLVTSRNRLTGLLADDGVHPVALDLLTVDEARDMLAARLGADRIATDPEVVTELIARCARLPLALAIAAAHAAVRPHLPLAKLVAELGQAKDRLDILTGDDTATDLRAVFSYSYHALSPAAARLFRLLGLHPGPDIGAPAAASLTGTTPAEIGPLLAELANAHLLTEQTPGRYALHDLLRAYAAEQAGPDTTALHRVLDHYLHTAHQAAVLLRPHRDPVVLAAPRTGTTPERLADVEQALAWFAAEEPVLVATVQRAADAGFDTHAWQLAWAVADFLEQRGHWHYRASVDRTALDCARRLGDRPGQAYAHRRLASAYSGLSRHDEAQAHAAQALDLYAELGDRAGLARTHHALSWIHDRLRRPDLALGHAEQSLDLYRAVGDRAGQATALNNIGWDSVLLGDYRRALNACEQALALFQELDDVRGQALTWDSLGYAHHHLGDHAQAVTCYRHALEMFRAIGDRVNEAATLTNLGDTHHAAGELDAAGGVWRQAGDLLDELDDPEAGTVRAKLALITT